MVDLYQLSVGLALERVETALQEDQHPLPEDLEFVLRCGKATPLVQLYLADNFKRKPPGGRPSLSKVAADIKLYRADRLIRDVLAKERKNGGDITITDAIEKIAGRGIAGFGKSTLWKAVTRYRGTYGEDVFNSKKPDPFLSE